MTIPFLLRLDAELKDKLDKIRKEEGIPISFLINRAIREYLKKRKGLSI